MSATPCSFENLQQQPFVAALDRPDPLAFVDQVEDVDHQYPFGGIEAHPQGSGRGGDDAGQRGQPIGIAEVKRDIARTRISALALPSPRTIRPTAMLDRTMSASTSDDKRRMRAKPPNAGLRRPQRRQCPAAGKRRRAAKKDVARAKAPD